MEMEQSTTLSLSLRQCIDTNWIEMSMYTKHSNILIKTTAGKIYKSMLECVVVTMRYIVNGVIFW